ncbi:hypothetical protein [Rhizobium sp. CC-YZS058]|uniref:hypothetical protein n=1 Tax=Rhizobium sp. CC-YZS058 TaxID=3042153 RepID=UPI002B05237E|nr:hypothetical protein [Rhizobium sp. CC-YZS058]MEA3533424.1 hypothetical protein [Rhizobium sp. CC-YZS058]
MSEHLDLSQLQKDGVVRRIRSVDEFCRRYRLSEDERIRLTRLFGSFASEHELLMNATRSPVFR